MNKKTKHCVFILDQTGSMYDKKKDTIGGFNEFLEKQKKIKKYNIKFSLILFNSTNVEKRYIGVDVAKVKSLTDKNYQPASMTPLWDAVGTGISENDSKKDVFFVILTDGFENASREFSSEKVKEMVKKKEKAGWGFLYLGVDIKDFTGRFGAFGMGISAASSSSMPGVDIRTNLSVNLSKTACDYYDTGNVKYDATKKQAKTKT